MKHFSWAFAIALLWSLQSCGQSASGSSEEGSKVLPAGQFAESLKQHPDAVLLDVRTPGEFAAGHLENALNANINDGSLEQKVASLDPAKPVYVYCLSGGRSASASSYLKSKGFKTVIDLQGGIMKWKAAGLPLAGAETSQKSKGMTQDELDNLLKSPKLVLIDFYAPWCQPCKKMAPYLEEIKQEMGKEVDVVRIDTDANPSIAQKLGVTALPTLMLYKNAAIKWRNEGYIEKDAVVSQLKSAAR